MSLGPVCLWARYIFGPVRVGGQQRRDRTAARFPGPVTGRVCGPVQVVGTGLSCFCVYHRVEGGRRWLLSGHADGGVRLWDVMTGRGVYAYPQRHEGQVRRPQGPGRGTLEMGGRGRTGEGPDRDSGRNARERAGSGPAGAGRWRTQRDAWTLLWRDGVAGRDCSGGCVDTAAAAGAQPRR